MCDTFDICTSAEESAFAGDYGEDGVWMLIENAKSGYGVLNDVAAEGVQGFRTVELRHVR